MSIPAAIFIVALVILVTYFVVFVERAAQDLGQLCQAPGWQPCLRWSGIASAFEDQYGGRDPSDLCVVDHLLPTTAVGWFATGESMRWLKDIASDVVARSADLRDLVFC